MIKPFALKNGDRVAIVSLSRGILGEETCAHQLELGEKTFGITRTETCLYAECA